jgi:hypothetical protein
MGKAPDEIRGEIEDTRERMTETAEAIRYRADVTTRAKDAVVEKKDNLVGKAGSAVSRVAGKMPSPGDVTSEASSMASTVGGAATAAASHVGDALPDTDQVKRQARQVVSVAQENPIGLAVGSIAVGFLAGMLLPGSPPRPRGRAACDRCRTRGDEGARATDRRLGAGERRVVDRR